MKIGIAVGSDGRIGCSIMQGLMAAPPVPRSIDEEPKRGPITHSQFPFSWAGPGGQAPLQPK